MNANSSNGAGHVVGDRPPIANTGEIRLAAFPPDGSYAALRGNSIWRSAISAYRSIAAIVLERIASQPSSHRSRTKNRRCTNRRSGVVRWYFGLIPIILRPDSRSYPATGDRQLPGTDSSRGVPGDRHFQRATTERHPRDRSRVTGSENWERVTGTDTDPSDREAAATGDRHGEATGDRHWCARGQTRAPRGQTFAPRGQTPKYGRSLGTDTGAPRGHGLTLGTHNCGVNSGDTHNCAARSLGTDTVRGDARGDRHPRASHGQGVRLGPVTFIRGQTTKMQ